MLIHGLASLQRKKNLPLKTCFQISFLYFWICFMKSVSKMQRQCDLYKAFWCFFFFGYDCAGTLNTHHADTQCAVNIRSLMGKWHMEQDVELLKENYKKRKVKYILLNDFFLRCERKVKCGMASQAWSRQGIVHMLLTISSLWNQWQNDGTELEKLPALYIYFFSSFREFSDWGNVPTNPVNSWLLSPCQIVLWKLISFLN